MLVALHALQPATVGALTLYLNKASVSGRLQNMRKRGLVRRTKWVPHVELTNEQRMGLELTGQPRLGKRPYFYTIAPEAKTAVAHFAAGFAELSDPKRADYGLSSKTSNFF